LLLFLLLFLLSLFHFLPLHHLGIFLLLHHPLCLIHLLSLLCYLNFRLLFGLFPPFFRIIIYFWIYLVNNISLLHQILRRLILDLLIPLHVFCIILCQGFLDLIEVFLRWVTNGKENSFLVVVSFRGLTLCHWESTASKQRDEQLM